MRFVLSIRLWQTYPLRLTKPGNKLMSHDENPLHIPHIRPHFRLSVPLSSDKVMDRFRQKLNKASEDITGVIVDNHIILDIAQKDVHYWSPQLNFRVEEQPQDNQQSLLIGIIGPRPKVWTLFMFIYFAIGIIGFFISSFGIARMMMGEHSLLIWAFPVALLLMLSAYATGKFGERLGSEQVDSLKQFIREAMDNKITELN